MSGGETPGYSPHENITDFSAKLHFAILATYVGIYHSPKQNWQTQAHVISHNNDIMEL